MACISCGRPPPCLRLDKLGVAFGLRASLNMPSGVEEALMVVGSDVDPSEGIRGDFERSGLESASVDLEDSEESGLGAKSIESPGALEGALSGGVLGRPAIM